LSNIIVQGYFEISFADSSSIVSTAEKLILQFGFLRTDSRITGFSVLIHQNSKLHFVFHNSSAVSLSIFSNLLKFIWYLCHSSFLAISGVSVLIPRSIAHLKFINAQKLSGFNEFNQDKSIYDHGIFPITFDSHTEISVKV
jgi:hypothetical protein